MLKGYVEGVIGERGMKTPPSGRNLENTIKEEKFMFPI